MDKKEIFAAAFDERDVRRFVKSINNIITGKINGISIPIFLEDKRKHIIISLEKSSNKHLTVTIIEGKNEEGDELAPSNS